MPHKPIKNNKKQPAKIRSITPDEKKACGQEEVQYIGSIQPHGFLLVIDKVDFKIVQYSLNFITLLNSSLSSPYPEDYEVLGTHLSSWLNFDNQDILDSAQTKATQISFAHKKRGISPKRWECLAVQAGKYLSLEFIPSFPKENVFNMLTVIDKMIAKVKENQTLEDLYKVITDQFQKYTQYDRVMLYKFHPDWSGEVLSESTSKSTKVKYLGLRFPAEDIPTKARELYLTSSLRIMADIDAEPVNLAIEYLPDGNKLDQSHSVLRSMSKMHVKYLGNIGVKASLSIGLVYRGKLWGLIALHHNTPKIPPNHLISTMKASCELFAEVIISYLKPAIDLEKLKTDLYQEHYVENIFKDMRISRSNMSSLNTHLQKIQEMMGIYHIGVILDSQIFFSNKLKPSAKKSFIKNINTLVDSIKVSIFESSCMLDMQVCPQLDIAGILAKRGDKLKKLIVFFAADEIEKEVTWGGQPHTVNIKEQDGLEVIEPRSSFQSWREKVRGQSRAWEESDRKLLHTLQASLEKCILFNESEEIKLELQESSYHDSLTGLANRLFMNEYIKRLKSSNTWITVFFLDLDNFKRINDYIGHHDGDKVLVQIAKRLQNCSRSDDLAVRLGGDEFLLIAKHSTDDESVNHSNSKYIAENILKVLSKPIFLDGKPMLVATPSIGVLLCSPSKMSANEILRLADIAMYNAKLSGKNKIHFFNEQDQEKVEFEGWIEQEIRVSLKNKSFETFFQPQLDEQGNLQGAEALARWDHPDRGFIPPEQFITIAEKNNLIKELGVYIFDRSCYQLNMWQLNNLVTSDFYVSINISGKQIISKDFYDDVLSIVNKYSLSPKNICLEITETIFMENFDEITKILNKLRKKGFVISLDDFGTGYSSLSYLLKLPIDQVKIDKSFIKNIQNDKQSMLMIEGIIDLCNKINVSIIAEGVETEEQLQVLIDYGCKSFQGYYFGPPVSASNFQMKYF